jgi:hypothetical protein
LDQTTIATPTLCDSDPNDPMTRWLRWALLIPAVWASWSIALMTGYALLSFAESRCPAELMVSGLCTAHWFTYASRAASSVGAAMAAVLIVLSCTYVAPSHRRQVATTVFAVGAVAAVVMGVLAVAWTEAICAVAAGALVTLWLRRSIQPTGPMPVSHP